MGDRRGALRDRGQGYETLLVYSHDDAGLVELDDHFGPKGERAIADGRARVAILPLADHVLTQVAARRDLERLVLDFLAAGREQGSRAAPSSNG